MRQFFLALHYFFWIVAIDWWNWSRIGFKKNCISIDNRVILGVITDHMKLRDCYLKLNSTQWNSKLLLTNKWIHYFYSKKFAVSAWFIATKQRLNINNQTSQYTIKYFRKILNFYKFMISCRLYENLLYNNLDAITQKIILYFLMYFQVGVRLSISVEY